MKKRSSRIAAQIDAVPATRSSPPDRPDLQQLLTQLNNFASEIERNLQQQFDLSLGEFEILEALRHKPLPQTQLSRRVNRTPSVVSCQLKRLVWEGWIARQQPSHDRRERVASLTRRGLDQHRRIRSHLTELLHRMENELTPEIETLLLRLRHNLSQFSITSASMDACKSMD